MSFSNTKIVTVFHPCHDESCQHIQSNSSTAPQGGRYTPVSATGFCQSVRKPYILYVMRMHTGQKHVSVMSMCCVTVFAECPVKVHEQIKPHGYGLIHSLTCVTHARTQSHTCVLACVRCDLVGRLSTWRTIKTTLTFLIGADSQEANHYHFGVAVCVEQCCVQSTLFKL